MKTNALDYIKTWLEPHVATFADKAAAKGEASLKATCDTLRAELGRQLSPSLAGGLSKAFAALVRERIAAAR